MSKQFMLLALAGITAAIFALPAVASAEDTPLHLNPTPAKAIIDDIGANPTWSATGGSTFECETVSGEATFESGGTTGTLNLTVGGKCKDVKSGASCNSPGAPAGTIVTTPLSFHLVTLKKTNVDQGSPGILVTPSVDGSFDHVECAFGLVKFTMLGTGFVGTITAPECGKTSSSITIDFNATAHGVQEHTTVEGTETEYRITKGGENTALDMTTKLTLRNAAGGAVESNLECT